MSRITAFRHESNLAQNLVLQFDQIHEKGPLIEGEIQLCKGAKNKILKLVVVRKIKPRQRSCLTWIRV
jgi:hypothetical protein